MVTYSPEEIALVGVIMTFGSVVQGAVGFGSGLLCVPLLMLSGFSIPEAATINLVSTAVQNTTGAWKLWSHLEPKELVLPVTLRILAIPCGAYVASLADTYVDPAQSKQLIGTILLVTISLLWGLRVTPRDELNLGWQTLAYTTSGLLMGFAAIGGAPLVIYLNGLTWTAQKSRAFLFFCSATGLPVVATAFYWEHGEKILPAATTALIVLPMVLIGLRVGFGWGHRLSKPLFRQITYVLLVLVAASAILAPLLSGAR